MSMGFSSVPISRLGLFSLFPSCAPCERTSRSSLGAPGGSKFRLQATQVTENVVTDTGTFFTASGVGGWNSIEARQSTYGHDADIYRSFLRDDTIRRDASPMTNVAGLARQCLNCGGTSPRAYFHVVTNRARLRPRPVPASRRPAPARSLLLVLAATGLGCY